MEVAVERQAQASDVEDLDDVGWRPKSKLNDVGEAEKQFL